MIAQGKLMSDLCYHTQFRIFLPDEYNEFFKLQKEAEITIFKIKKYTIYMPRNQFLKIRWYINAILRNASKAQESIIWRTIKSIGIVEHNNVEFWLERKLVNIHTKDAGEGTPLPRIELMEQPDTEIDTDPGGIKLMKKYSAV